jgi:hypothetical protein
MSPAECFQIGDYSADLKRHQTEGLPETRYGLLALLCLEVKIKGGKGLIWIGCFPRKGRNVGTDIGKF